MNPNLLVKPYWAKYKATDQDGRMYWYEYLPVQDWKNNCWINRPTCRGGQVHFAGYADGIQPDWSKLLEEL